MRTTIDIPDDIYRKLKIKAAGEGQTVREITLRAIQQEISRSSASPVKRLTVPILKSHAPGSIRLDNEQIYDIIGFP